MRIAICTVTGRPSDVTVWSGTPANLVWHLSQREVSVVEVGPLHPVIRKSADLASHLSGRFLRRWNWEVEPDFLAYVTREVVQQMRGRSPDVVLAMGWLPWGLELSRLPWVFWGDATIAQRVDDAPHWSGLSARTRKLIEPVEGSVLRGAARVLMPSRWACEDAMVRYGLDADHVVQLPFGANISDPGPVEHRLDGCLRILTVGVKWHRKGMDRAVRAVDALVASGYTVHLDVVGLTPPSHAWLRPYVTYHGFLSKEDQRSSLLLDRLYRDAHLFLLASRHDPFPMVLAEAAAYGLPVVATNVSGVSDRVRKGGLLVDEPADAESLAACIELVTERGRYAALCEGARMDFLERSSWQASVGRLLECLTTVVDSAK